MNESKARAWAVGDPCPACGDELAPQRAATPEEWAAAQQYEHPRLLPTGVDTAPAAFIAEHGDLHTCRGCGYQARVKAEDADQAADAAPAKPPKPRRAVPASGE